MQENNFEKGVRQKLDELRLTPTEPVWQRIEAAIQKKKKRRLLLWLLPLVLIGSGVAVWQTGVWGFEKDAIAKQTTQLKAASQQSQTFSKPHSAIKTGSDSVSVSNTSATQTSNSTETITVAPQKSIVETTRLPHAALLQTTSKSEPRSINSETTADVQKETVQHQHTKTAHEVLKNISAQKQINQSEPELKTSSAIPEMAQQEKNNTIGQSRSPSTSINPSQDRGNPEIEKEAAVRKNDSLQKTEPKLPIADSVQQAAPAPKKLTSKKIRWEIVSRIGASNAVAGVTLPGGLKSDMANKRFCANCLTYNTAPGVYNLTQYSAPNLEPATISKGLQFAVGVEAKKPMRNHLWLTAGLQYSLSSYRLSVGYALPNALSNGQSTYDYTLNNAFRNNGGLNRFTNIIHTLDVPVGVKYRLFKKLPLQAQHGFTLSQVLASRVLQYDGSTNTYYQTSTALRKTSVQFFTALSYPVWRGDTFSLLAGPHIQYGLQPLFKDGASQHLLAGGVTISMAF